MVFIHFLRAQMLNLTCLKVLIANIFAFPYGNREYKEMIEQEKQISDKQQSDITKEDELK